MNNNVVIKITDADNGLDFEIPIESGSDSPLSINKQLTYLEDLTRKGGVQSRKIEIPISKEISENYDFIAEAQHHNYKDVDSDKDAVIIVNGNELEKGKIRVLGYSNTNGNEELKLIFFGNNFGWTELIKEMTLADIDYDTPTINYTPFGVKSSWVNSVDNGDKYVFPLENRGGRELANEVHTNDFRPALFFYSILERSLQNIGYTFSSDFMNTTSFKRLIISFFGKRFRYSQEVIEENNVVINNGFGQSERAVVTTAKTSTFQEPINFGNGGAFQWVEVTDDSNNFNTANGTSGWSASQSSIFNSGTFTAPKTGNYKFKIKMNGDFASTFDSIVFTTFAQKSTDPPPTSNNISNVFVGNASSTYGASSGSQIFLKGELKISLKAGEVLEFHRRISAISSSSRQNNYYYNFNFLEVKAELLPQLIEGATFDLSDVLDDKVKVLDIINDVSRIFNLVWDTDLTLKKITVEPRDDYYGNIVDAIDVTTRVDMNSNINTFYNSNNKHKKMVFSYANDSSDGFVKGRNDSEESILAEYTHDLPIKFKEGVTKISCNVLAASYPIKDIDSIGVNEDADAPWTTRYWKEYTETIPDEILEDHSPRLLNYVFSPQSKGSGNNLNSFRFYDETSNRTLIPYCLPHQIRVDTTVQASTGYNLYFNRMHEQDGLFNNFWSKTVTEIIDGKNIEFNMLFDQRYWNSFSFRKVVFINEPIDIKGYWIVEKLGNYQPENSSLVKVRALKRIEYPSQIENTTLVEDTPIIGTLTSIPKKSNDLLVESPDLIAGTAVLGVFVEEKGILKKVTT